MSVRCLFRLIGNAILVTAFLSYCGPFNQEFRQRLLNEWQKQIQQRMIPFSDNFNLIEQLNDEATVSSEEFSPRTRSDRSFLSADWRMESARLAQR